MLSAVDQNALAMNCLGLVLSFLLTMLIARRIQRANVYDLKIAPTMPMVFAQTTLSSWMGAVVTTMSVEVILIALLAKSVNVILDSMGKINVLLAADRTMIAHQENAVPSQGGACVDRT